MTPRSSTTGKADPTLPGDGVEQGGLLPPSPPQALLEIPTPSQRNEKDLGDFTQTQTECLERGLGKKKQQTQTIAAKGFGFTTVHSPREVGFATALL